MRKNIATIFLMVVTLLLLSPMNLWAINGFVRSAEIPVPEADLNNGGIGGMISGVDVDGDGKTEIYLVNDNWSDGATEVIPRIYKLEYDGSDWVVVWSDSLSPFYQNTWPCLSLADLDGDTKMELVWGPVNSTAVSANPDRILVYEHAGGDVFGVDDGAGGYNPNASWTIVTEDDVNLRPMDWDIADIDDDSVDEIIFADRKGNSDGYYLGVCSVDDIPDNGDGSETWTLEVSGKDFGLTSTVENKWDVAVIENRAYFFSETEISKLSYNGTTWEYTGLSPLAGGSSVQSAQVVDLNGDGIKEIITAVYDWGDDAHKAVMLLREDGDTLKHYELVNTNSYFSSGSRGLWGGASGDIDQDGYLDFVFGSRAGDVNASIFMLSYKGGNITDPASYEFSVIDEAYVAEGGIWGVINIANIDDDPELEVLYTSSASYGGDMFTPAHSAPIIVLDPETVPQFEIDHFVRSAEIPVPEADLNNGGIGGMISGVDVDGDGKTEIYLVNDNWSDGATEVIPRIYKLEYDGSDWVVVWSDSLSPFYQNTWPCLSLADLDGDTKMELVWGPVNSTAVSANPDRILVYEHAGGDVFGVDDGAGGYNPNASWTIVTEDDVNLRPMDWDIADIDDDSVDEIIFADRKGNSDGYYLGVCSVDDIPDNGDGSETWTLEVSGKDFGLTSTVENKWDVAVIENRAYFFSETEISKLSYNGTTWEYTGLSPLAGGSSVQSAQVVDLNGDGIKEIITAVYDWGDDAHKAVMLLREDGDTLKHYELVNTNSYFSSGSRGLWGGASGDIDQDGYLDFVFGSRAGDVNASIFMLSYKGGNITDPASYEFSVIDEAYVAEGGIWGVINIANIDDDPELEVLYTSSASYGGDMFTPAHSAPIIVLDPVGTSGIEIENKEVLIAEKYVLHQNYPNPFNPTTTIAFDIPVSKHVRLIIYDMLGREVISLVDNELQPGRHSAIWNGKDKYGHNVSTGVYIYQLRTENITRSKTMTFIK